MEDKNQNQDFTIGKDETYYDLSEQAKKALAERSVTYHELLDNTQKGFESGNKLENGCEAYGNQQKMMAYTREMLHLAKEHLKFQELLIFDVDTEFNRKESERLIQRLEQQSIPSLFHLLYLMKKKRTAENKQIWRECSAIKLGKISLAYTEKEALELADFLESCQDHEDMPPLETIYGPCYIQAVIHLCERLCSVLLQILALPAFPNEKRRVELFFLHLEKYRERMGPEIEGFKQQVLDKHTTNRVISKKAKEMLMEEIFGNIESEPLRKLVREYGFSHPSTLLKEMRQHGCRDKELEQVFKVLIYTDWLNELTAVGFVLKSPEVLTSEGIGRALEKTLPLITKPGDYFMVCKVIAEISHTELKRVKTLMGFINKAITEQKLTVGYRVIESSIRDMGNRFRNENNHVGQYDCPKDLDYLEFLRLCKIAEVFEQHL